MAEGEMSPDQVMATMLNDPELDESEIYQAIKNDTNGIDEGDLNHLEGEEGEDTGEEAETELGEDDEMEEEEGDYGMEQSDED
jgi:hypothetical protein